MLLGMRCLLSIKFVVQFSWGVLPSPLVDEVNPSPLLKDTTAVCFSFIKMLIFVAYSCMALIDCIA